MSLVFLRIKFTQPHIITINGMKALTFRFCTLSVSCNSQPTCEDDRQLYTSDSVDIVVMSKNINGRWVHMKGYEPSTQKETDFNRLNGFLLPLDAVIGVGDTLIKEAGSTDYMVRKRNINVFLRYNCNSPSSLDTLSKRLSF